MRLSKYEQETIIIFNAGEAQAELYTREKAIMRKMDALVNAFPEVYKLTNESEIDKTYSMPKTYIKFQKPRKIKTETREDRRKNILMINSKQANLV